MELRKNVSMKNKIDRLERELSLLKQETPQDVEWKMPAKWARTMKKSRKKVGQNQLLFIYMRKNGKIEPPKLVRYTDDVVVYNYKAYYVDPRAVWDWGKYKIYLYKEMDRRPVSNLNYKLIQERGDLTDGDEILIKATMRAIQEGAKKPINKAAMVIIGIVVLVFLAYLFTAKGPA